MEHPYTLLVGENFPTGYQGCDESPKVRFVLSFDFWYTNIGRRRGKGHRGRIVVRGYREGGSERDVN